MTASATTPTASGRADLRLYVELMKPRVLALVIFTALPALGMAAGGWPSLTAALPLLLGIALSGGAANALNCFVERDRDALMERTRNRPLPSDRMGASHALGFGIVLACLSTAILYASGGPVAAALGVATILFYVFVYTVWLKPRSAWNAVVGGAAGAAAPLIADAAMHGTVTPAGLALFAIIFVWQPPHVWAIALYRKAEYAEAGIPMLPHVIGDERTRWRMLFYALALVPVTLAPTLLGLVGWLYGGAALLLGGWFTLVLVQLIRERSDEAARRAFFVSLAYLALLFVAMLVDLAV